MCLAEVVSEILYGLNEMMAMEVQAQADPSIKNFEFFQNTNSSRH